jgi:hypothetical protein
MIQEEFIIDQTYGERLLISKKADQTELNDNIRVAYVLLSCFEDMTIRINEHLLTIGHKNPEYTINGKLGDRKGVESENGIKSAFRKAKLQGCKVVVLDFDMHMSESILKTKKIVSGLFGRHEDFTQGALDECYVVHNSKAVVVKSEAFASPDKETIKQIINDVIEKLRT